MEQEEKQSLELMQGIAEAKARLSSLENPSKATRWLGSTNRGGGGRESSFTRASSQPRLQMQPLRGSESQKSHQSSSHRVW